MIGATLEGTAVANEMYIHRIVHVCVCLLDCPLILLEVRFSDWRCLLINISLSDESLKFWLTKQQACIKTDMKQCQHSPYSPHFLIKIRCSSIWHARLV